MGEVFQSSPKKTSLRSLNLLGGLLFFGVPVNTSVMPIGSNNIQEAIQ